MEGWLYMHFWKWVNRAAMYLTCIWDRNSWKFELSLSWIRKMKMSIQHT